MKQLLSILIFTLTAALSADAGGHDTGTAVDTGRIVMLLDKGHELVWHMWATPAEVDSAVGIAQETLRMSRKLGWLRGEGDSWLIFSYAFYIKRDRREQQSCLDSAMAIFKGISCWRGVGEGTLLQATFEPNTDSLQLRHRIALEKEALSYALRASDSLLTALCYLWLGEDHTGLRGYSDPKQLLTLADTYYGQALAYYGSAYCQELQDAYLMKTCNYYMVGDYDEAVRLAQQAVSLGEEHHDSTLQMAAIYNQQALTYITQNDFTNAVLYGRRAVALAIRNQDTNYIYICSCNIATALGKQGRYSEAIATLQQTEKAFPTRNDWTLSNDHYRYIDLYLNQGRPDLAWPHVLYLMRVVKKPSTDAMLYKEWYLGVSRYYFANKEFEKTLQFLSKYAANRTFLPVDAILQVYELVYRADSALGRNREALADHIVFKNFSDSLFNEKKSQQIALLNVHFDTERKDRQLMLQHQELQLQQASLGRSQAARKLYMYMAISLVLLTGLLVGLFRLKVTKNRALTLQQAVINSKNENLEHLLREKDWLLKEVHHRVKNNLQIVMSLLNSQSMYIGEGAAFEAIRDSQARVHSMAMIHQKLYTSPGILTIDLPDYITDLVNYFRSGYTGRQKTEFLLELTPVMADVSVAVPLALILNEAITNALKHAFPDRNNGMIHIWLAPTNDGEHELGIADDGVGFRPTSHPKQQPSLGMSLIHGLTEDIGGNCIIENSNGISVRIKFSKKTFSSAVLNEA